MLLISSRHHPAQGGIGSYIWNVAQAESRAGWRIELITRMSDRHPAVARVHAITTPDMNDAFANRLGVLRELERVRPYRYGLWSLAVARKLLEIDGDFDAIEFVDCQAEGWVSLTSRKVRERWKHVPMIVHAHAPMFVEESLSGADVKCFGRTIYHRWEREALEAADGVISPSRLLIDRLRLNTSAAIIPLPLTAGDDSRFVRRAAKGSERVLACIGPIQPGKGVDIWAKSLRCVLNTMPRVRAVLVGPDTPTGPDGCSMVRHVESLVGKHHNRVRWLGPRSHEDVLRVIAGAAAVIVPSVFESFSYVAAEAIMCGTPVIVSDQVGLREHVPSLPTFPARDIDALAAAQLEVLANSARARRQVARARNQLVKACAPARIITMREDFLSSLRSNTSPQRSWKDNHDREDAIEQMESFLGSVERAEEELSSVSSLWS